MNLARLHYLARVLCRRTGIQLARRCVTLLPKRWRVSSMPSADDRVGRMEFLLSLRRHGITDAAVLHAMDEVPREYFVASTHTDVAYADQALPIACGQT